MTRRLLQAVLRSFADIGPPLSDGELLTQFVASRSEAAFAELVRRHGRLVWTVCRHLTGSDADADDAFQATFVVLLQNARKIRDAARLSSWLYGVAHRVCGKARLAAKRRTAREHARAAPERNGDVVSESAWDRALAAVHEEVAKLPDNLRLPFVLCCLEGKGVGEAAAQLGWKLGTFSGRLTRAKDAVLARLDGRSLTLGAVAGVAAALPPAAVVAKTAAMAHVGFMVPSSILPLTQGVIGMSMKSVKLLAASFIVMCGLGLGAGWMATAGAQPAAQNAPRTDPLPALPPEQRAVDKLAEDVQATLAAIYAQPRVESYVAKTTKWEYDFVVVSDLGPTKFVAFLQDRENRGWEFNGQSTLLHDGKPAGVWVFRRPAPGSAAQTKRGNYSYGSFAELPALPNLPANPNRFHGQMVTQAKSLDAQAIKAQIDQLQKQLQALNAGSRTATFTREALPLEPGEFTLLLKKLVQKRFPNHTVKIGPSAEGIAIEADPEVRQWIIGVVNKMSEKADEGGPRKN